MVIDPIDDAVKLVASLEQDALQAAAEIGRLHFAGIRRAHGGEHVGKNNARLQEIDVIVILDLLIVEQAPRQAEQRHVQVPECPLIGEIVNRAKRLDLRIASAIGTPRLLGVNGLQISGQEAGLPVVDMHHVRPKIEQANRFEHGPAEETIALAIVGVIDFLACVVGELIQTFAELGIITLEVARLLDEIDRNGLAVRLGCRETRTATASLARPWGPSAP